MREEWRRAKERRKAEKRGSAVNRISRSSAITADKDKNHVARNGRNLELRRELQEGGNKTPHPR